jgi:hypothetical protein
MYTMLAPVELLCSWRQQYPSIQGNTESSITRKVERVHYRGGIASKFTSVLQYVIPFLVAFKMLQLEKPL